MSNRKQVCKEKMIIVEAFLFRDADCLHRLEQYNSIDSAYTDLLRFGQPIQSEQIHLHVCNWLQNCGSTARI